MKPRFASILALVPVLLAVAGCATAPAPDPGGKWQPVNRFAASPQPIPLRPAYVYYAAPLDRTLKGLLERWAADGHMKLDYRHPVDFTLYQRVSEVRSDDLRAALAQLAAVYVEQRVALSVDGDRIVAQQASPAATVADPSTIPH